MGRPKAKVVSDRDVARLGSDSPLLPKVDRDDLERGVGRTVLSSVPVKLGQLIRNIET